MSELVRPKCSHRLAGSLMRSVTAVVKAMTSWLSTFSSSRCRAANPAVSPFQA